VIEDRISAFWDLPRVEFHVLGENMVERVAKE
jgi:hypothetical protein